MTWGRSLTRSCWNREDFNRVESRAERASRHREGEETEDRSCPGLGPKGGGRCYIKNINHRSTSSLEKGEMLDKVKTQKLEMLRKKAEKALVGGGGSFQENEGEGGR